jgi:hypothetical protein
MRAIKFWTVVTLTGFALAGLNYSSANAAVKAGAACKKAGQTSSTAGVKYICSKSGKKFVWKQVAAAKPSAPAPMASPSPAASKSPAAEQTPAVVYPAAPTSFDDLVANYQGIAYAAWSNSRKKILESKSTDIKLKMVIGPNTQLTYKEPQVPIDLITRLYAGYPVSAEVQFLAFSFEDRAWATNQMESILPNSGSRWITDVACNAKEVCWGGGAFTNGAGKYLIVEAMGYIDTNHTSGSLEAHEFTHIVQQMVFKKGRPADEYLYDPWPPTWYWEGQAHFAQHASIYFDSFDTYMQERRATAQNLYTNPAFNSDHIRKFFVFNAPQEWRKNYNRWQQYDLGAMFVEILTALKGPDSTMEMWRITGTGVNFPEAFEKVYGMPFDKALPIMSKAIALQLGRS